MIYDDVIRGRMAGGDVRENLADHREMERRGEEVDRGSEMAKWRMGEREGKYGEKEGGR